MTAPDAARPRWPAEWEPHRATWLGWPHNPDTWPGHLEDARDEYVEILRALQGREAIELVVPDEATADDVRHRLRRAGADPEKGIRFHPIPTNDVWFRDTAPVFVDRGGVLHAVDFDFNAWGGKYPPWELDAALATKVAAITGAASESPGFVLEGGSLEGDGAGTLLTTEQCLLHPNREAGRDRAMMEARLGEWLGAERVVWLPGGIAGDDTDGHIDDVCRFVAPGVVVAASAQAGADQSVLEHNRRRLAEAGLEIHDLPMPPSHRVDGEGCPASYANFYLANGVVLVPTFGASSDARALAVLSDLLPDREVLGIPCRWLIQGLGAIHCLTQQEPAL
ncbi:MAG: agmatine deiminase family protein [Myxococcota bacterium]